MQLRRIRLTNLRSYESADLSLGPGTTLLSGDVGSGKTSMLYAIEMALFGFAEVDPAYLVRHQAGEAEVNLTLGDGEHKYEFSRKFRRRRRRGRDVFEPESASFSDNGATATYSVTELRQRAIQLLGFPDNPNPRAHSDLWRWAVYVPQERMREVLAQDPEERLETVRKALGLEQYRTAAENSQLLSAELRRMGERSESEARGRDHLVTERPTVQLELEERESQVRAGALELDRQKAELRAAEAHVAEIDSRRRAIERDRGEEAQLLEHGLANAAHRAAFDARSRRVDVEFRAAAAARDVGRSVVSDEKASRTGLEDMDRRIAQLRLDRESRTQELSDLAAAEARRESAVATNAYASLEVERAHREAAVASEELARLEAEEPRAEPRAPTPRGLEEIDAAVDSLRARTERSLAEISRWEHIAAENEELRSAGVCPRCHQRVDPSEFASHFLEVESTLARERELLGGSRKDADALGEERRARERFERSQERWRDLDRSRTLARDRSARAHERAEEADRSRDTQRGALDGVTAEVARLRPVSEAARSALEALALAERERSELERRLIAITAQLDATRSAEASLHRLETERTALEAERTELGRQEDLHRAAVARVRERLAAAPAIAEELTRGRERLEGARNAASATERALERAGTLAGAARARLLEVERLLAERQTRLDEAAQTRELAQWFSQDFREAVLALEHRLLARAQVEFERSFSRFFTTLVEDPSLIARCDAAFSPAVEIDGEWTPSEALSGGERTALALAFRLALGQVVRAAGRLRLETLILDEPTDGFSPEQVVRMGELLDGLGLSQVLLVSHENELTSIADRVVRVEKSGGRSTLRADGTVPESGIVPSAAAARASLTPRRRVRSPRLDAPEAGPG